MSARRWMTAALAGIALSVLVPAHAHPHVWIEYTAQLQMDGHAVVAIAQTWRFTKGFPVQLAGIDSLPQDGPLDAKQTAIFKQHAFASLAHAGYFSHVYVDGKAQSFVDPDDFRVSVDHGRIVYAFTLKLASPVNVDAQGIELGIWDDSFFVAYEPAPQGAVTLGPQAASTCTITSFTDHDHPIFNGIVVPKANRIAC